MNSFTERRTQNDVPDGDSILYDVDDVNNYRLPTFGNSFDVANGIYSHLPNLKLRDDDVFLNSYPKTGSVRLCYTKMLTCIVDIRRFVGYDYCIQDFKL